MIRTRRLIVKVDTTKSKNAESFYIRQSYVNADGKTTSKTIRKLGTLKDLLVEHGPTRDDVMRWAREQARIETENYKVQEEAKTVLIALHADRKIPYHEKKRFQGGYLFLQYIYYNLGLDRVCRKIRNSHQYEYDLNAILSDLIYTRILDPSSKRSSYKTACSFLERPDYGLHDIYRALSVLAEESDLVQTEVYKNSNFLTKRNDHILYYDCTNYYFEIEQELPV